MFILTNFTQKVHKKMHQRFQIITTFGFCYVENRLVCKKIQTSQKNNSIILWIRNTEFSQHCF